MILSITLNTQCGLSCIFCRSKPIRIKSLESSILEKIVKYIEESKNLMTVVFSGGEPFLDKRIEKIILVCKNKGVFTSADTNCNWIDLPKYIFEFNQIRVKLLSLIEAKHDRLVGRVGHYKKVIEFMDLLTHRFSGSRVLLFPVLRYNLEELEQIAKFAIDKEFYCNFFSYPRSYIKTALTKQEYHEAIKRISILIKEFPEKIFIDFPIAGAIDESLRNICPATLISTHVDVDGYVQICRYFPKKVGSLKENSLSSLWRRQMEIVKALNSVCLSCELYSYCGGGCLANKYNGIDYYCSRCKYGGY